MNQIEYIMCTARWRSPGWRVTTLPGADCGTDDNLLKTDVKIKFNRIKSTKLPPTYDVENISDEYTVEVNNRFSGLQLEDSSAGIAYKAEVAQSTGPAL